MLRNTNLRTPYNADIATKKDVLKTSFDNGAHDGLLLEQIKLLCKIAKSNELAYIESTLSRFVA